MFTKLPPMSSRSASSCQTTPYYAGSSSHGTTPYYMPPSPLGMFPPRVPGRPCYAPQGELTPKYSNTWPEEEAGYEPDTTGNPSSGNTPTASGYSPSGFQSVYNAYRLQPVSWFYNTITNTYWIRTTFHVK